jgi:hypothetical protein
MFNFQSLAKAITPEDENKSEDKPQYIEDVGEANTEEKPTAANGKAPEASTVVDSQTSDPLGESTTTLKPYEETQKMQSTHSNDDEISPAPPIQLVSDDDSPSHFDQKHLGEVSMMHELNHQATQ